MTLLSMCMNLMQEQIVEKVSWIAEELGMKGDGNDEEVVKLSIEVSHNFFIHITSSMSGKNYNYTTRQGWQRKYFWKKEA